MNQIAVAKDTIRITAERKYDYQGQSIALPDCDFSAVTVISPADGAALLQAPLPASDGQMCAIEVTNESSFGAAARFPNPLVMNYDTPLDYFGGRTAYQVSLAGYAKHNSQQYTWFTRWAKGNSWAPFTKATQISTYSPLKYGLYRSTVGPDSGINDMFEHITAQQIKGDPDGDSSITAADAQLVLEAYAKTTAQLPSGLNDAQSAAADIDGDGAVTSADAQLILAYYTVNTIAGGHADWAELTL